MAARALPDDILLRPAHAQRQALLDGRIGAVELTRLALGRIETVNPALNAVVTLDTEGALRAAAESERRIASGVALPLDGLPITVKDALDVAGMVSTAGSPTLRDRVPSEDATAVARVRRAGAVILGKTNVPVFSGDFQTANPLFGVTRNPWNTALSPGGSSGGAAVAVATGMASFELATDLGGSGRWPAAATGIFGLRTTWNHVSTWGMVPPPPEKRTARNVDLVAIGPLARDADDLSMVLDAIGGPRDPFTAGKLLPPPRRADPKGLRVAVWAADASAPAERAAGEVVRRAADALADAGAVVGEARPAFRFAEAYEVFALLNHAVVAYGLPAKVRDRIAARAGQFAPGDLSHEALQARGARMTPGLYQEIAARKRRIARQFAAFFASVDVILCPVAPVTRVPQSDDPNVFRRTLDIDGTPRPYMDFLGWASLAAAGDCPAAVAPFGFHAGMPAGVQIIGPSGEDRTPAAVAGMLAALGGGYTPPPLP
jgi:amidase